MTSEIPDLLVEKRKIKSNKDDYRTLRRAVQRKIEEAVLIETMFNCSEVSPVFERCEHCQLALLCLLSESRGIEMYPTA